MALVERIVNRALAQMINIGIVEVLCLGDTQHFITTLLGKELPLVVEQLQSVPLAGIMTGSNDDAAGQMTHAYSQAPWSALWHSQY